MSEYIQHEITNHLNFMHKDATTKQATANVRICCCFHTEKVYKSYNNSLCLSNERSFDSSMRVRKHNAALQLCHSLTNKKVLENHNEDK